MKAFVDLQPGIYRNQVRRGEGRDKKGGKGGNIQTFLVRGIERLGHRLKKEMEVRKKRDLSGKGLSKKSKAKNPQSFYKVHNLESKCKVWTYETPSRCIV